MTHTKLFSDISDDFWNVFGTLSDFWIVFGVNFGTFRTVLFVCLKRKSIPRPFRFVILCCKRKGVSFRI